jgi:hypothetical protein
VNTLHSAVKVDHR